MDGILSAIRDVGTPVALIAFIVGAIATVVSRILKNRVDLIRTAPEKERARLISTVLPSYTPNPEKLTQEQRYNLVMRRLEQDASRFKITAIVFVVAAILVFLAVVIATLSFRNGVTLTPIITPTLAATANTEGSAREVLVLVTKFKQISGNSLEPHEDWNITLRRAIDLLKGKVNARVVLIPQVIESHDDARSLSKIYRATMVIWGRVRAANVEAFYTITPRWSEVRRQPGETAVQAGELEELSLFVGRGGDTEYVLNFVLAQMAYYGENRGEALPFLNECIRLAPKGREAAMALAAVHFYRAYISAALNKSLDTALVDVSTALKLDPNYASAYYNRGLIYYELKRY